MAIQEYITIRELCTYYQVDNSFFRGLREVGLIEVEFINHSDCIRQDDINDIEKMVRLHQDLQINKEGIDTIFNLLKKINTLQEELKKVKGRLSLYEHDAISPK